MVIADTSVWIPFFNRPGSAEKQALDALIDADEIAMIGVVLAELLQGCRARKDRDEIADALFALPYLEMTRETWVLAGGTSSLLLRRGVTLPISDLVVAALSLERQCQLYSLDGHFKKIPDLARYHP
ncbi:MAG TPA: PIN domain-containing protein [Candidatus Manganitrophaceae bacterium]